MNRTLEKDPRVWITAFLLHIDRKEDAKKKLVEKRVVGVLPSNPTLYDGSMTSRIDDKEKGVLGVMHAYLKFLEVMIALPPSWK